MLNKEYEKDIIHATINIHSAVKCYLGCYVGGNIHSTSLIFDEGKHLDALIS